MTGRTIDEALDRFQLIDGVGDGETTACSMSVLSWVHGEEEWTDSPDCAHLLVRSLVMRVNDAGSTTPEDRARIVRAGEHGVLDTWWMPATVILRAIAEARGVASEGSDVDRLVAALDLIALWKVADHDPSSVDLAGADLAGVSLAGADLAGVSLAGADLRNTNLAGANLAGADLRSANLVGANLAGVNLARVDLWGADLTNADLRGANLAGADLAGVNLWGALRQSSDPPLPGWTRGISGRLTREAAS